MRTLLLLLLASAASALEIHSPSPNGTAITPTSIVVTGSTLTVATSGIITAPSQPSVAVSLAADKPMNNGALTDIHWDTVNHNRQGMFNAVSSSNTFTARGAGLYLIMCKVRFAANVTGTTRTVRIISGGTYSDVNKPEQGNSVQGVFNYVVWSLADGATVKCQVNQDSGGALNVGCGGDTDCHSTSFSMTKLW